MPQFDIFSFFSQLFWVFLGFSYLYLVLCFYILPAFATILKVRAKKLALVSNSSAIGGLVVNPMNNLPFFETLAIKLNNTSLIRTNLNSDVNMRYNPVAIKNDAISKFNLSVLVNIKLVTIFF